MIQNPNEASAIIFLNVYWITFKIWILGCPFKPTYIFNQWSKMDLNFFRIHYQNYQGTNKNDKFLNPSEVDFLFKYWIGRTTFFQLLKQFYFTTFFSLFAGSLVGDMKKVKIHFWSVVKVYFGLNVQHEIQILKVF